MTRITQTFVNSGSFVIPSNAINIKFSIRGGAGGSSPSVFSYYSPGDPNYQENRDITCQANAPSPGAYGQYIAGDLDGSLAGSSITFVRGTKGDDNMGPYGSAADPGSLNGVGYHNGGPGGLAQSTASTGSYICSRSGGCGGGGSSAFITGSTVIVEAGGGAGAGGSNTAILWNTEHINLYIRAATYSGGINGGGGGFGSPNNSSGSGGGGGGYSRVSGQAANQYASSKFTSDGGDNMLGSYGYGFPGIGGNGFVNSTYISNEISYTPNDFIWTDQLLGVAEISYEEANAPTVSLSATLTSSGNPVTSIYKGENVTITYSATGVGITSNTFTATDAAGNVTNPIPGTVGASGVYYPAPLTTTTYTYTSTNAAGTTTESVVITVIDDTPTITLVSNRTNNTINRGQDITLTWSATANQTITSTTMTSVANPGTSGSLTTIPSTGDSYFTFTATNASGTATITLTVTTVLLLPTASLTSNDPQADNTIISGDSQSGDPTTLTWSAGGYDITNYSMTGVANPGSSGSTSVSPNVSTTYTYTVTNATGSTSASKTITVYNRPVITLTAPTNTISRGAGIALTWATTGDASSIQWTNGTPIPSSTNINGTELVYPQNSTQYCVIATGNGGISSTVCFDVNVVVPDPSITDYDTTFTADGTAYIPPYAINVTADISAGSGGTGGTDSGGSGGGGGSGRRAIFYFPDYVERTFTIRLGSAGSNGFGCVANSGSGSGGSSNVASGGRGGRSGPSGCSGGGGGGGGASSIYDSLKNGYVVVVGGGSGGGGASWNRSAVGNSGQAGKGLYNGSLSSIQNGAQGADCPTDGGGGGGGGGGAGARPRGDGGAFGLDNNVGGSAGQGGGSSFDISYCTFNFNTGSANYGNGWSRVRYDIGSPEITSFTASPSTIIRGASITLAWTSNFSITGSIDQGVGSISVPNGSIVISPQNSGEYYLTVIGPGGVNTDTASVNIIVYIPPVLVLTLNSPTIIVGGSTTLSWFTTGDGSTLYWTSGGITNGNLTSFSTVNPTVTTTYSGYVTGLGGTSPVASVVLIVYYPPTLTVNYPAVIDYGQQSTIEYEGDYANTSVTLSAVYNYDFVPNTTGNASLNTASSAEFGPDSSYSGTYNTNIVYTDRGPLSVTYTITASGSGGSTTETFTVPINVDITPDNMGIEESEDLFKDQVPIVTPDSIILGEFYEVKDVDIKVEVKSDWPINVDINKQDDWKQIREI